MTDSAEDSRAHLRHRAETFDSAEANAFKATVVAVKTGDVAARLDLCAGLLNAGFRNPYAITALYDAMAEGWLGSKITGTHSAPAFEPSDGDFSDAFWSELWRLFDDASDFDALSVTARVAALGGQLDPKFGELAERAASAHPGAANAQQQTPPPMINLSDLASAPEHSLARNLHSMLVDNGYDAEVLDRQALGLSELPPALSYLNTRILQMHDVWHLTAGYRTTSLHEIAISSFQLAQFGHNYSAMFLAVVLTISSLTRPEGLPILLQVISEAWQHGRATPALMAIHWEEEWHKPIERIRQERGIDAFESALPADLLETLAANA